MRTREKLIEVGAAVGLSGHTRLEIVRPGGIIRRTLSFPNIITNAGLDAIGNGAGGGGDNIVDLLHHCAVGTSNTAPAATDTALGTQEGSRTTGNGGFADAAAIGAGNAFWEFTRTRVFLEGTVDGVNLAEVGFFQNASGGPMWMRQLIKDDMGTPTTISLASDEQLRVIYKYRIYPNTTVASSTVTIDSVSTDIDVRAHDIDSADVWGTDFIGSDGMLEQLGVWTTGLGASAQAYEANTMPSTTTPQTGSGTAASSINPQTYTNGNFFRDVEYVWDPGVANFVTGVGSVAFWGFGSFGSHIITFDPKIQKDNTERLRLQMRCTWGRRP